MLFRVNSFQKKKMHFGDNKDKIPACSKFLERDEYEELWVFILRLLHFTTKILKSGFIAFRLEVVISVGSTILSDK